MGMLALMVICWLFYMFFFMDDFSLEFESDFVAFLVGSFLSWLAGFVLFLVVCIFTTNFCATESVVVKDYNIYKMHIENSINSDDFYAWKDPDNTDSYKCLVTIGNKAVARKVSSSEIRKIDDPTKTKFVVYDKQYSNPTMRNLFWLYVMEWESLEIPDKYIKIDIDFR